jgi:hypothetical protein
MAPMVGTKVPPVVGCRASSFWAGPSDGVKTVDSSRAGAVSGSANSGGRCNDGPFGVKQ